ncbi:MAG: hypothetical protein EA366_04110 [Spirulina sp. DLM2.Bin59]|nr:MAG: hypothetical protein EA366_04110 [Spirulina sp. DLM2.Bin59]
MANNWCFCTLAVGKRYREHAKNLVEDIQKFASNIPVLILTDKPEEFAEYPVAQAINHRLQSVKGYHDKRFVIAAALRNFKTCLFLDSDVRIIGPVPENLSYHPGITARTGCSILKHNARNGQGEMIPLLRHVSEKLDIDLGKTKWFHEFMFAVTKQDGAELKFLSLWQTLAYFFEMQGFYGGEGNIMGLAASKVGLDVSFNSEDPFPFFKDNIERVRIKNNQSNIEEKSIFFEVHRSIEFPKYPIWQKLLNRLIKWAMFSYRTVKLRFLARKDAELPRLF